ncbi:DUF3817 domain-containing protein [Nesterenkonia flava]|uniref:DUF3817 domain-containing protein n=1 Tax=Nesterenkonia flava TaxID=469799 RepID=A0ABU1FVK9_9MICC|nr:DUF3817 domain-containing protein [Nesterenkonia flava]MDR5712709.1 DUF3817 domain-containing protein [Nesterenkonia flava]
MTETAVTPEARTTAAARTPRGSLGWQKFIRVAFHVVAITEAITWAGLLYGMYQRYIAEAAHDPVPLWGMLHGIAFMVFCAVVVLAAWTYRWKLWEFAVAIGAAVPPLFTIPLEIWYSRTGKLKPRR